MRYIHRKVLEEQDRVSKGIIEPDRPMAAMSVLAPDKSCLYVLVNETRLGHQWAALFKSTGPGSVVYSEDDVREEARGDKAYVARAQEFAKQHTLIPAVQRKYPQAGAPK